MTQAKPKAIKLTFEEYLKYDDGTDSRYELVDGEPVEMNQPTWLHILIADYLKTILQAAVSRIGEAWLVLQGPGQRTTDKKSRLPDLLIIPPDIALDHLNEEGVLETSATLVVEIISPSTSATDYRAKRSEYAAKGIPEYWIVDAYKQQITVFSLNSGFYDSQIFTGSDTIKSPTLGEIPHEVETILQAGFQR